MEGDATRRRYGNMGSGALALPSPGPTPENPMAVVQQKGGTRSGAGNLTLTWDSPTTLHNLLIIVGFAGSATFSTPSGWSLAGTQAFSSGGSDHIYVFYKENAASQSSQAIAQVGGGVSAAVIMEISGAKLSAAFDAEGSTSGNSGTASSGTSGLPSQDTEMAIAGLASDGFGFLANAPTGGFSQVGTALSGVLGAYKKVLTGGGAQTCTDGLSPSDNWGGVVATFRSA